MTKDDMRNATRYPLHAMCYLSPVTRHPLLITHYFLRATRYQSPAARYRLITNHPPSATLYRHPLPAGTVA